MNVSAGAGKMYIGQTGSILINDYGKTYSVLRCFALRCDFKKLNPNFKCGLAIFQGWPQLETLTSLLLHARVKKGDVGSFAGTRGLL
jgi:hypothetical protein